MIVKDLLEDHYALFRERIIPEAAEHVDTLCSVHFDHMSYQFFEGRTVFKISVDAAFDRTLECYYRNALIVSYLNEPVDDFPALYHLSEYNDAGKIHLQKKIGKIKFQFSLDRVRIIDIESKAREYESALYLFGLQSLHEQTVVIRIVPYAAHCDELAPVFIIDALAQEDVADMYRCF